MAAVWLLAVLFLSKNLGAMIEAVIFAAAVFLLGRRAQIVLAVAVAAIVMFYPMLRGAGWIPVDAFHDYVASIDPDRAASLKFRLDNEDELLAHANEKPLVGWGGWGRHALHDPETGAMTSTTDGTWIGLIGVYGWLGYIGSFGLLTAPILFYAIRRKPSGFSYASSGVIMALCATLIDLLPNSGLVNYVWLMAGAVAGAVLWRDQNAKNEPGGAKSLTPNVFAQPARAAWLMAEEAEPTQRRTRQPTNRKTIR